MPYSDKERRKEYIRLYIAKVRKVKKLVDLKPIYAKTGGRCVYCGKKRDIKEMERDHVVPPSLGGVDITMACSLCNAEKQDKTLEEWRYWIKKKTVNIPYIAPKIINWLDKYMGLDYRSKERKIVECNSHQFWFEKEGYDIQELFIKIV